MPSGNKLGRHSSLICCQNTRTVDVSIWNHAINTLVATESVQPVPHDDDGWHFISFTICRILIDILIYGILKARFIFSL